MKKIISVIIALATLLSVLATATVAAVNVEYIFDSETACENLTVSSFRKYFLGDINGDGIVSTVDRKILRKILAFTLKSEDYPNADVNGDDEVTSKDLKELSKIILGSEESVEVSVKISKSADYDSEMQSAKLVAQSDVTDGANARLTIDKIDATSYTYAVVTYMTPNSGDKVNSSAATNSALGVGDFFTEFALKCDGRFHSEVVDLSGISAWNGDGVTVRYFVKASAGDTIYIDSVIFCATEQEALSVAAEREQVKKEFSMTSETSANIADYTVVTAENPSDFEKYAAEILCARIYDESGVSLEVGTTAETFEYEILIGSAADFREISMSELSDNQYTFFESDGKIILGGCDYMIGGAVAELCAEVSKDGSFSLDGIPKNAVPQDFTPVEAKSVILMIGDGMGFNHVAFTDSYVPKQESWAYDYSGFTAKSFPSQGECTTLSASDMSDSGGFKTTVTDSAAAATALATGWKTQNKKLGYNLFGSKVKNIRELAAEQGLKTAVISTEDTTGATPAAFTVHNVSRSNIDEIRADQTTLVENGDITYLSGNLPEEHQLLEETKTALNLISEGGNGFFAMIEEAYIDKSCDRSYETGYTRDDTAKFVSRFDEAVKYAATFTTAHPGTVLIVTADHETGALNIAGYVKNGGDHTDLAVPVYALGYGCEQFNGITTDNVKIARFMASVFGASTFGADVPFIS